MIIKLIISEIGKPSCSMIDLISYKREPLRWYYSPKTNYALGENKWYFDRKRATK